MLAATCHRGAVRVEASEVQITRAPGATSEYSWGDKSLRFVRCSKCGCITHWEPIRPEEGSRIGVNARNFDPSSLESVRIRLLDGAST